jgi:mono/diheme cytochrome c family protein
MKRIWIAPVFIALAISSCARRQDVPEEKPKAFGTAVAVISGDKQAAGVGSRLDQPLVVQVNDAQGAPVSGALVRFAAAGEIAFQPDRGLTGADGQFTATVTLGGMAGHYQVTATTLTSAGKSAEIHGDEIALGYQEMLGEKINEIHCIRCHDSESTPERVSNHDNLDPQPRAFTEGAILNRMSDASLLAMISHGGSALNKSPQMPPYGNTLTKAEMVALVAYIRAVADPPYRPQGVFYAGN